LRLPPITRVEPKTPSRFETDVSLGIQDIGRDAIRIKCDVNDLCFMALGLITLSVINLFLTVYCAVSVYQIKHSTSKAVQMEANQ
jgi:hypothetical protein